VLIQISHDMQEQWQYGCILVLLHSRSGPLKAFFSQPEQIRIGSSWFYRVVLAGMQCFFSVSSHAPDSDLARIFPHPNGEWGILASQFSKWSHLSELLERTITAREQRSGD
jgi:hypothetical protein